MRLSGAEAAAAALAFETLYPVFCRACRPYAVDEVAGGVKECLFITVVGRFSIIRFLSFLATPFTHFNEVHLHPSLKLKSPLMSRRELTRRAQGNGVNSRIGRIRLYGGKIISPHWTGRHT